MTYRDDIDNLRDAYPSIASAFEGMKTLEDVFKWIREVGPEAGEIDVIAQDEFSHDVVVELTTLKRYAAFGVT